jgi:hypothetical protein
VRLLEHREDSSSLSAGGECLRRRTHDLVVWDVPQPLGDVPAMAERIDDLSVAFAPELIGERVSNLGARRDRPANKASASSVPICRTVAVPPIVRGETMPNAGNSLPT